MRPSVACYDVGATEDICETVANQSADMGTSHMRQERGGPKWQESRGLLGDLSWPASGQGVGLQRVIAVVDRGASRADAYMMECVDNAYLF